MSENSPLLAHIQTLTDTKISVRKQSSTSTSPDTYRSRNKCPKTVLNKHKSGHLQNKNKCPKTVQTHVSTHTHRHTTHAHTQTNRTTKTPHPRFRHETSKHTSPHVAFEARVQLPLAQTSCQYVVGICCLLLPAATT